MKVLQITNNYPTENLPSFGIFVKEQIDSLTDEGIHNEVFFINGYEKGKKEYLKQILKLYHKLKFGKYDLVHCHHALSALTFALTPGSGKIPSIMSYQSDPVNEHGITLFNFLKKKIGFFIFKNNSKYIRELSNRAYYLPNGVNADFFKPIDKSESKLKLNLSPEKKYIIFTSSFLIRNVKRVDRFDATMKILQERYPESNYEALKLVHVTRDLMPYYFSAADLHLLTSDFEGSPNSVKESMCCNTPVVSTNVGNVEELFSGVVNCFVADESTPEKLAELSHKAVNIQADIRNAIFEKGYDRKTVAKRLKKIYQDVIGNYENRK
jgi:glycosyltransferase involved in cell wall biosynthesis